MSRIVICRRFGEDHAEIADAQTERIDAAQSLDVVGLRGRVGRILGDLRPDQFGAVRTSPQ
jgi:hypothetical protein